LPPDLRAPSADRCKTLPHDLKCVQFYNLCSKIWLPSPKKFWGPKISNIWGDFGELQTSIANISGMDGEIQNRKDVIDGDSSHAVRKKVR